MQVINGELMLISYAEWFRAAAEILGMQILSIDGLVIISYKHCRTGLFEMQHLGWISLLVWPIVRSDTPKVLNTTQAMGSGFSMVQSLVPASGRKGLCSCTIGIMTM